MSSMFLVSAQGLWWVVALAVLAGIAARRGRLPPIGAWLAAWILSTTAILLVQGGLGHTWGPWSVVGKLIAFALTVAMPFVVAAGVAGWIAKRDASRPWLATALFASGAIAVLAVPWTGLWLVYLITGDSL